MTFFRFSLLYDKHNSSLIQSKLQGLNSSSKNICFSSDETKLKSYQNLFDFSLYALSPSLPLSLSSCLDVMLGVTFVVAVLSSNTENRSTLKNGSFFMHIYMHTTQYLLRPMIAYLGL